MKKNLGAVVAVLALIVGVGCGSGSSGGGGGGSIITPPVDLVVFDADFMDLDAGGTTFDAPALLFYFDVLNDPLGGLQDPDVILDATNSGLDWPRNLVFVGDDLYTGDNGSSINIFRDYRTLTDGDPADVTLTDDGGGAGTISGINNIAVGNDTLFAVDRSQNQIYIFAGASALAADGPPDATLTTSITSPVGLYYDEDDDQLFVAQNTDTSTDECVTRYDNASAIVANQAPDAVLGVEPSFDFLFNGDAGNCRQVFVDEVNDRLFVTTDEQDHGESQQESAIFQFDNASTFANDDLPAAMIFYDGTHTLAPNVMTIFNDRLWVATKNSYDDDFCQPGAGVEGFALDETGNFVSGQDPDVLLTGDADHTLSRSQSFAAAGGFFFVQNFEGCSDFEGLGNIFVYNAQFGGPFTGDAPFLILPAAKDFATAAALAVNLVDSST